MPPVKSLAAAIEDVIDAVVDVLQEEQAEDGLLDDVRTVIRGDRNRTTPVHPALWVFGDTVSANHSTFGLAEQWSLPLAIVAVVDSENPEAGYRQAMDIAARAGAVVKEDPSLGNPSFIKDVKSRVFHPSSPWEQNNKLLYASAYVLEVVFTTFDGG